jgi:hypothetical protein
MEKDMDFNGQKELVSAALAASDSVTIVSEAEVISGYSWTLSNEKFGSIFLELLTDDHMFMYVADKPDDEAMVWVDGELCEALDVIGKEHMDDLFFINWMSVSDAKFNEEFYASERCDSVFRQWVKTTILGEK